MRGFINLLKPTGMTSNDAVVKVRGILKRAAGEKVKVGHLGTLDPGGAGVLPIAVGSAARLFDYSAKKRKRYLAGFKFGVTTDTLDSYGKIIGYGPSSVAKGQVLKILPSMEGEIDQVPPDYSAISVNGVRAYKLARQESEVKLESRKVNIFSINLTEVTEDGHYIFDISCEGGTYIRSIARDMAAALGTVGYMSFIIRLTSGEFDIASAVTLDEFQKSPLDYILPVETFTDSLPRFDVPEEAAEKVLNGVRLQLGSPEGDFAVYIGGKLIGVGKTKEGLLTVKTRL